MPKAFVVEDSLIRLSNFSNKFTIEDTNCWVWQGYLSEAGYGKFGIKRNGKLVIALAHRWLYEIFNDVRLERSQVCDHLCRNRACVNPKHIEIVTDQINILRGEGRPAINARKTHCKYGHEFTKDNTMYRPSQPGTRECKTCHKLNYLKNKEK